MAGLFPGIANSQNVDANGTPLANAQLTVYNGGTLAQSTVYQDINLLLPGQNPMTADVTGRLPLFYVSDGIYRVRLVDKTGILIYDYLQVASIGASTSGGGGTTVDPTTVFQTGDVMWLDVQGTRTGWVRENGRTIGSATSGASERANADCQNLFLFLWNNYADAFCPVVGGRGVSAAADWAANKQITLRTKRGGMIAGLDDMGNAAAGAYAGVPVISGSPTTASAVLGENTHTLSLGEAPIGLHSLNNPTHTHTIPNIGNQQSGGGGVGNAQTTAIVGAGTVNTGATAPGLTLTDNAGGSSHNNVPIVVLGTFYRKL